ncbi:MAG: ATP-binding cassette domain-containing protein [Lachnospiraceae bacterium]|nr:ATP-binding cassette domain-containing protein [Lachnospiraceae bacterium]
MEIRMSGVSKSYGKKQALEPLTLSLSPGIYALLGPNGAGKSTMMNILAGVLAPTTGGVYLDRRLPAKRDYARIIGYLPQRFGCYDAFTGRDMLYYFAAAKGMPRNGETRKQIEDFVRLMELEDEIDRKISGYSGGMRQRLGIIQAFLGDPSLLLLDEPTAGLDPKQRLYFREMLERKKENQIILLSTHILSDVDEIADVLLLLKEGRLVCRIRNDEQAERVYARYFG